MFAKFDLANQRLLTLILFSHLDHLSPLKNKGICLNYDKAFEVCSISLKIIFNTIMGHLEDNDFSNIYNKMHDEKIMFTYKGLISHNLVNSFLEVIEPDIYFRETDLRTRKKMFSVLVECLQNAAHHGEDFITESFNSGKIALVLVTQNTERYCVRTGNAVLNNKVAELKEWIETINILSTDELKNSYQRILDKGEFSNKGTAGLGFIDIARKTGQKLEYEFKQINDLYSIFSFSINIDRIQ